MIIPPSLLFGFLFLRRSPFLLSFKIYGGFKIWSIVSLKFDFWTRIGFPPNLEIFVVDTLFRDFSEKKAKISPPGWWTPFLRNMNSSNYFSLQVAAPFSGGLKIALFLHFFAPPGKSRFSRKFRSAEPFFL